MKEYQQALDNIKTINLNLVLDELGLERAEEVSIYGMNDYPNLEMEGDIKTLQELVDKSDYYKALEEKAMPKKPDYEGDGYDNKGDMVYDTWICPNCNERYEVDYDDYDYCPKCGQALDWSDEDGNN